MVLRQRRGAARVRPLRRAPTAADSARCSASRRSAHRARRHAASQGALSAWRRRAPIRRGTYIPAQGSGGCGRCPALRTPQAPEAADTARAICWGRDGGRVAHPQRQQTALYPRRCIPAPHAPRPSSGSSRFCGSYPPKRRSPRAHRGGSSMCSGNERALCPAATLPPAFCASRGGTARQGQCSSRGRRSWG